MLRSPRKIAPVLVSSLLALALIPMTATSSQAVTIGAFKYSIAGKTATVLGCNSTCPSSLEIPATVPGTSITVTSIGRYAFVDFMTPSVFSSISLPASVTSIQEAAFHGVTVEEELILPTKLNRIERLAFSSSSIYKITFNKGITFIGDSAFDGSVITIKPSLQVNAGEIGSQAFEGVSFDKVTLGENVSSIGSNAFAKGVDTESSEITALTVNGGDIGMQAFAETKIGDIVLGAKIGNIGPRSFAGPSSGNIDRGKLSIASGIIEEGAFRNSRFAGVNIGKAVLVVGSNAFGNNSGPLPALGNVSIDARIISPYALANSTMSSLSLGSNVASIGMGAFGGNDGPYTLGVVSINGGAFSEGSFRKIVATKTTISSNVKKIAVAAFNASDLGQLSVNAQQIGESAFFESEATALTLGSNVKHIGLFAFFKFQITGPNKVVTMNPETIGSYAFSQSNITGLTLGSKVRVIETSAFSGAGSLETVVVNSGQIGNNSFGGTGIKSLVIGPGVTSIGDEAFYLTNLDSLDIANGLTVIGESAFSQLNGELTTIRIPNSVVTIGEDAFNGAGLSSVLVGSGLKYLEEGAFSQNDDLTNISFYGPPPVGDEAIPIQAINLRHTASNLAVWTSKFAANQNWSPSITRISGLAQPSLTFSVLPPTLSKTKLTINTNYSIGSTGKVQVTVTKSGSKAVLCTKTVSSRNTSVATGVITCDLSKKVRDELKKKALTLSVTTTYTPDLGAQVTSTKSSTFRKQ